MVSVPSRAVSRTLMTLAPGARASGSLAAPEATTAPFTVNVAEASFAVGVTVTEVYEAEHGPRAKVEIAVDDGIVEPVLEAIANISRTGRIGDGKIIVGNLEQAIRIRTGETGPAAT